VNTLRALWREERDTYLLGLVRIAFGAMLLRHIVRLGTETARGGYFGDFFHLALLPEALVPARAVYVAWLALLAIAAVCVSAGFCSRAGLLLCSLSGVYFLLCDRLQYHNNRYSLLLLSFLLAFTPCDRSFTLRGLFARARDHSAVGMPLLGPYWAVYLLRLQVSLTYFGSATGKLLDPDWRGGQVMLLRGFRSVEHAANVGWHMPAIVHWVFTSPEAMSLISKAAIGSELFLAIGLWLPRTRVLALWIGVLFHLGIELSAHVELFSYVMWSAYIAFARPERYERALRYRADVRGGRVIARVVRGLDWLARFRIETLPASSAKSAPSFIAIDRDGSAASGVRGWALLARALPMLFPLWLPLHVLALIAERGAVRSAEIARLEP
jgi:hypothetical protein